MNKEIIDYILKSRGAGQSDEQIKENLLTAGWMNENIDRGFNSSLIQDLILKNKADGLKDKQIIENLINNNKFDKDDVYNAYDYLVKKFGRKIMPRYYILWMPFFHRLRYRADIHSYIFKRWGFLNPFSGRLISTKTSTGKLMVGILLIFIIWFVYRSLSIPSTISSIKTELSRMSGSNTPSQSVQTAIISPITESTAKGGWKVYTDADYKLSIQLPCRDQNREMCFGGMSGYGSNYETNMVFLSTETGLPDIRITTFSDEDIKKYNNKLISLGFPSTASYFYYSLPKMYEALNLSPGQSCQIFDENNRYYGEISYRQCLVTTINGQKSLQLSSNSQGNITYLIPRGGTLWLEIIGLDDSYMKELLSNLNFAPGQPNSTEVESPKMEVATISPILLKDLDAEALKSSGWSWYGSFPSKGVILDWADRDTFTIYPDTPYFKDKNRVYYDLTTMLEGADSATFVVYDNYFAKDKNRIYLSGTADYPQALDVSTFEKVDLNYFKDKSNVYFSDLIFEKKFGQSSYYHLEPINGLDAGSFKYLGICGCVEKSCAFYVKDKNNAFCGYNDNLPIIDGADSATFEYVGQYNENPEGMPVSSGIAKDKNCVYRADKKVLDINDACFSPVNCTKDNLANGCGLK